MKDTIVRILTDERDQARADSTEIAGKFTKACARIRELEAACRLALPVTRENLPKSHDAYQAIKAALAAAERVSKP